VAYGPIAAPSVIPYTPPDEPESEQQGYEGSVKSTVAFPIAALARFSQIQNDPQALDLGMRLTRFGLKGPMWEGFSSLAYPGNQQGIFAGNFQRQCPVSQRDVRHGHGAKERSAQATSSARLRVDPPLSASWPWAGIRRGS
jgi:hypothetical protein